MTTAARRRDAVLAPLGLVIALVAPVATAQEPCVPTDLAMKIFGYGGESGASLFTGAPPAGVADDLPLPAGAVVLGGTSREGGLGLVATSEATPERVLDELRTLFVAAGWKPRQVHSNARGGFVDARVADHGLFCGPDGEMLQATVSRAEGGGSLVRYSKSPKAVQHGPCSESFARRQPWDDGPMPTLSPPSGVRSQSSGSCGSSGGRRATSVVLATPESPLELAAHFADQLEQQGWTFESEAASEMIAAQVWSLAGDGGEVWRGILVVASLTEETRDAAFSVALRE